MENLNKNHIIILEFLELLNFEPISLYELEQKTRRKYITIKSQIDFLVLLELAEMKKIPKGKLYHYEITITEHGNKIKEKINFNLHK